MACIAKLNVMNSQIGCSPASAAPTARPAKPDSVMGVSMTLFSPKRSSRPFVTLYLYQMLAIPLFFTHHQQGEYAVIHTPNMCESVAATHRRLCRGPGCTYAPLNCATSSPSMNVFGFASSSSDIASFNASRTDTSFEPLSLAYLRHRDAAGADTLWKLHRGSVEGVERRSCAAGRRTRGPTMAA